MVANGTYNIYSPGFSPSGGGIPGGKSPILGAVPSGVLLGVVVVGIVFLAAGVSLVEVVLGEASTAGGCSD